MIRQEVINGWTSTIARQANTIDQLADLLEAAQQRIRQLEAQLLELQLQAAAPDVKAAG